MPQLALALKLANDDPSAIQYFYKDSFMNDGNDPGSWHQTPPPPSPNNSPLDPQNKVRDSLGTTHHEAGTLWMGTDPNASVTDLDGRFHNVANAYVAGPAVFPTLGSANPSLTALTLARKTALAIVKRSLPVEAGFTSLGTGGLTGWQMAGFGGFVELGANIIETVDGIGLLWYQQQQFTDFILRVDWRASFPDDNSGVFIRFPALGNADPANDWKLAVDKGYEIQIDDTGKNPDVTPNTFGDPLHITGSVYKPHRPQHLPRNRWGSGTPTRSPRKEAQLLSSSMGSKSASWLAPTVRPRATSGCKIITSAHACNSETYGSGSSSQNSVSYSRILRPKRAPDEATLAVPLSNAIPAPAHLRRNAR
jgi:hypothetical protein